MRHMFCCDAVIAVPLMCHSKHVEVHERVHGSGQDRHILSDEDEPGRPSSPVKGIEDCVCGGGCVQAIMQLLHRHSSVPLCAPVPCVRQRHCRACTRGWCIAAGLLARLFRHAVTTVCVECNVDAQYVSNTVREALYPTPPGSTNTRCCNWQSMWAQHWHSTCQASLTMQNTFATCKCPLKCLAAPNLANAGSPVFAATAWALPAWQAPAPACRIRVNLVDFHQPHTRAASPLQFGNIPQVRRLCIPPCSFPFPHTPRCTLPKAIANVVCAPCRCLHGPCLLQQWIPLHNRCSHCLLPWTGPPHECVKVLRCVHFPCPAMSQVC